jgi:selenocysteine-specific elongation factor
VGEVANEKSISLTIGTAGHVDHGKTTLVRYMTGTDTDRLEEEHRRGISIIPGYAELDLPGGRRASLVDVPGHERFVKNMVAGSTGVDAFLLVVAADDGVMPQTREHLDVLRVLGVEDGVVALSKVDAVDEETAELAQLEVEELLESAGMSAPIVPVSGVTGDGVDALLRELDALAAKERPGRGGALARMPVDRAFVLQGIGLVVTGTLWSGEIRAGDTLYTSSGHRPRVRGIQNHGRPATLARAGARTALDLTGVEASRMSAGDVLLSGPVPCTPVFDARIRLLESARKPLLSGTRLRLHHGTRATNARIRLHGREELRPGESALARLRLEEPLVALPGDRFVLRSTGPQVTIGGGTVLDPSPSGRRPEPGWLEALESGDLARVLPLALARNRSEGVTAGDLALVAATSPGELRIVAESVPGVKLVGERYALSAELDAARDRLLETLRRRAREHPESPELTVAAARSATGLGAELADALLGDVSGSGVRIDDAGVSLSGAERVPEELEREAEKLLEQLSRAGAAPPALEMTPALRLLVRRGEAVEVSKDLFASREAERGVLEEVVTACRVAGELSLADFRDRLGTSRKFAQAWLEHADAAGITRRTGDVRVLTRRYRQQV